MSPRWNPIKALLIWLVRGYQILISPLLPRSCKYYPSCSQYAVDALTQYGVLRGIVLTGWRLLRCNPWSYGGYDPVEQQALFGKGHSGASRRRVRDSGRMGSAGKVGSPILALLLALVILAMPVAVTSCGFFGTTETTAAATTTVDGAATVPGETTTTTTLAAEQDPGSFDKISKPLQALFFAVLDFFHDKLHVSWSWAIVLLTVVVRIVLIPLTWRQIKSMRAMQALQPELKALQEKYKDDRQILNQKVMEFYRENKVSPFSSCLPLLLQMPVFLGLFYMLRTAGRPDLDPTEWGRWASIFVDPQVGWLWIKDITTFDIGLLFLYVASQFLASWQMARKGAGQQKVISYMMPIVVGIFMFVYKWPAGLFIYWFTSNLWTIAQQFVLEKVVPAPVAVTPGSSKGTAASRGAGKTQAGPSGKATGKASEKVSEKPGGRAPGKATGKAPAKASGKAPAKSPGQTGDSPKKKTTPAQPAAKTPATPSGKSGGKTSGQQTGKQGKAAGSTGQRPDGGTGGSKGSGGT